LRLYLLERHGLHPTQFFQWQKQFFENGAAVFASRKGKGESGDGVAKVGDAGRPWFGG
jgi:hypothetical protein